MSIWNTTEPNFPQCPVCESAVNFIHNEDGFQCALHQGEVDKGALKTVMKQPLGVKHDDVMIEHTKRP